jgi:hypothetical protein
VVMVAAARCRSNDDLVDVGGVGGVHGLQAEVID